MDEIRLLESLLMEMEGFLSDAIHYLDQAIENDKELVVPIIMDV
jgi:hypothetical protein